MFIYIRIHLKRLRKGRYLKRVKQKGIYTIYITVYTFMCTDGYMYLFFYTCIQVSNTHTCSRTWTLMCRHLKSGALSDWKTHNFA